MNCTNLTLRKCFLICQYTGIINILLWSPQGEFHFLKRFEASFINATNTCIWWIKFCKVFTNLLQCINCGLCLINTVVLEKKITSVYFHYFPIIFHWIRVKPFTWINLNLPHPRNFVSCFVGICTLVREKKILKCRRDNVTIMPLKEIGVALLLNYLESP